MEANNNNTKLIVGMVLGGFLFFFYLLTRLLKKQERAPVANKPVQESAGAKNKDGARVSNKKRVNAWATGHSVTFSPSWQVAAMKGHTGQLLDVDYSSNGKYIASCGEDRAVFLWDAKDFTQKDRRSIRINIEFDHATFVKWSPDSKAFIIQKYNENTLEVYKVEKKKDGFLGNATKALTFPKVHGSDVVIGIGIASNGTFIMSCSNKTEMVIWDLKGGELARIDTYLMSTVCAKISPCSRFVVASGFAPDVKVWEVVFNKSGDFVDVKRVFDLTGHTSGVHDVAFDADSSHMATVSKDGTWKLYDTKIEYKKGESPHLKQTGKYEQSSNGAYIALSPNAEVVVIATGNTLYFYSTVDAQLDHKIENLFTGNCTKILFDAAGKYLLAGGDKQIRVFHNVTGYKCSIATAKEKLKQSQTSATRDRLENLIRDSEKFLNTIK